MGILDLLFKSPSLPRRLPRGPRYNPFSEPRYSRPIPVRAPGRYTSAIPNALLATAILSKRALPLDQDVNQTVEDRRRWAPYPVTLNLSGVPVFPTDVTATRPTPIDPDTWRRINKPQRQIDWRPRHLQQLANAPWWYGFATPQKTVICVKRKIRREIMHALGFAGRTGQRSPRFNEYSHVRC